MDNEKKTNEIAYKPNRIIQAGQQMLPFQQRIFLAALMKLELKLNKDDFLSDSRMRVATYARERTRIKNTTYQFPVDILFDDFESLRLTKNADFTRDIERKVDDIVKQIIRIKNGDSYAALNIISYAEYVYKEKMIYIRFSKDIIPILLGMFKDGFTKIRLVSFVRLRSGYAMRIYEELLRIKNMEWVKKDGYTLPVRELYFMLGIENNKGYKLYTNFRQDILLPAQKEIAEKTGLSFKFKEIKEGKRISLIKFYDIFEDINKIKKNLNQLSLFDKNEIDTNDILSRISPEEDSITPMLDKIKEIEPDTKKVSETRQQNLSLPTKFFTDEQEKKLDKYLDGIFSADDIKSRYEFDYIEFYYRKAMEKNDKGTVKDFAGFLYKALTEDKYKYYELKEKKKRQEEEKIAKEKLEREKKREKEQAEKRQREQEAANKKRWEALFDSFDEEKKKTYLEKLYSTNDFYRSLDQKGITDFTKWAIGAMIDSEQNA